MKPTNQDYAVLTGDLVGSRRLSESELKRLFNGLKELWEQFGQAHGSSVVGSLEIYRGDGWQAALSKPALAVDAAVFLRAAVKAQPFPQKTDTRIGIGIGEIRALLSNRLSESNGMAFQRSGEALESLSREDRFFGFQSAMEGRQAPESAVLFMMDLAIQRWSKPEAAAAMGSLLGWKQEMIAEHPYSAKKNGEAPTRQAVSDTLGRIGWKSHWLPALAAARRLLGGES